jgi:hypothetical protein
VTAAAADAGANLHHPVVIDARGEKLSADRRRAAARRSIAGAGDGVALSRAAVTTDTAASLAESAMGAPCPTARMLPPVAMLSVLQTARTL